jgi:hypothetical protein
VAELASQFANLATSRVVDDPEAWTRGSRSCFARTQVAMLARFLERRTPGTWEDRHLDPGGGSHLHMHEGVVENRLGRRSELAPAIASTGGPAMSSLLLWRQLSDSPLRRAASG